MVRVLWEAKPLSQPCAPATRHCSHTGRAGWMTSYRKDTSWKHRAFPQDRESSSCVVWPSRHLHQLQKDEATFQEGESLLNLPLCKHQTGSSSHLASDISRWSPGSPQPMRRRGHKPPNQPQHLQEEIKQPWPPCCGIYTWSGRPSSKTLSIEASPNKRNTHDE